MLAFPVELALKAKLRQDHFVLRLFDIQSCETAMGKTVRADLNAVACHLTTLTPGYIFSVKPDAAFR